MKTSSIPSCPAATPTPAPQPRPTAPPQPSPQPSTPGPHQTTARGVFAVLVVSLLVLTAGCQCDHATPASPGPHQNTAADGKMVASPGPHQ